MGRLRELETRYELLESRLKALEEAAQQLANCLGHGLGPSKADVRPQNSLKKAPSAVSPKEGRRTSRRSHDLQIRFSRLEDRLSRLERMCQPAAPAQGLQVTEGSATRRLSKELKERGVGSFRFVRVPRDYYERDLEFRRQCLSAASVQHLCKSIVMENTRAPTDFEECGGFANSKFYCVIIQYAARLHAEKLKRYLANLNGKLGSKNFNMRLAPSQISDRLTSYTHNAVTPICMATRLPIIMSHCIEQLRPDFFWLGAGEVDLKVGMSAAHFIAAYKPIVVDCTYEEVPTENTSCLSN